MYHVDLFFFLAVEVVMRRKLDGSYSVQLPGDDRMLDISGYITEYDSPAMTVSGSVDNHSFGCKAVFSNDTIHLFTEVTKSLL